MIQVVARKAWKLRCIAEHGAIDPRIWLSSLWRVLLHVCTTHVYLLIWLTPELFVKMYCCSGFMPGAGAVYSLIGPAPDDTP